MKKLLTVLVAAMFAATSFAALAQDTKGKDKAKAMDKKPSAEQKAAKKPAEGKAKAKAKDAK